MGLASFNRMRKWRQIQEMKPEIIDKQNEVEEEVKVEPIIETIPASEIEDAKVEKEEPVEEVKEPVKRGSRRK